MEIYLQNKGQVRPNIKLLIFLLILPSICFSQTKWNSSKHNYSIEIPKDFEIETAIGSNVDFRAEKGSSSIVVVVKSLPTEYTTMGIWQIIGDLNTFISDWELEMQEYMNNPTVLKSGKSIFSELDAFWVDYTTDNPKLYSKSYNTKKGNKIYAITLTCPASLYNSYAPIWLRFKNNFVIK